MVIWKQASRKLYFLYVLQHKAGVRDENVRAAMTEWRGSFAIETKVMFREALDL